MKIAVIGGGPAGLAAAHTLLKLGAKPVVLEASDRLGGRVYTQHRDGFVIDLGAQFLSSRYRTCLALCRELGIHGELTRFRLNVGVLRNGAVHSGLGVVEWPQHLAFAGLLGWLARNRKQLDRQDALSTAEFGRAHYGTEFLENWFQPFISGATAAMPEQVAASCALQYMWYNLASCLTLRSGLGMLIDALAATLPEIRLNAAATRIVLESKRAIGVEFRDGGKRASMEVGGVVVATTARAAGELLPDEVSPLRGFLGNVPYTSSIHVVFGLRRKAMSRLYAVAVPRRANMRVALLSEDANKCPAYVPAGCGILHAVTYDLRSRDLWKQPDADVEAAVGDEIRAILPNSERKCLFSIIHRWAYNMCIVRPNHAREAATFLQSVSTIGGLAFAGDYLTLPCVEGAVMSGVQAAQRLAGNPGIPP